MVNPSRLDNKENIYEVLSEQRRLVLFTSDQNHDVKMITAIATLILNQEPAADPKQILKVRIKEFTQDTLSYTQLETGLTKTVENKTPGQAPTIDKVKKISLTNLIPKETTNAFVSFLKSILELVTHPIRFFFGAEHLMAQRSGISSRHTFKATIQLAIEQFKTSSNSKAKDLAIQLEMGLKLFEKMYDDAVSNTNPDKLNYDDYKTSKEFILPIGVGEGKDYIPHFLQVSIHPEKGFIRIVKDFHLSSPSAEKKVFVESEYQISKYKIDDFLKSLTKFIPLDVTPRTEEKPTFRSPFFKWVPFYDELRSLFDKAPQVPISEHSNIPIDSIAGVLIASGAELQERSKEVPIRSTSANPLKVLFEFCQKTDPKSKTDFYLNFIDNSIASLNLSQKSMKPAEWKKAIEVLKRDVKSLGKALRNEYGHEVAEGIISEILKTIGKELDLKGTIKAQEEDRIKRLNIEPVPFKIHVNLVQSKAWEVKPLPASKPGGLADALDADFVRGLNNKSPSIEECKSVLKKLNEYLDEIDAAHDKGNFEETKIRLLALLKALPVPTGRSFKLNGVIWNSLDAEGLDEAMKALSRLSNLVWERELKTWDFPVTPSLVLEMNMLLSANLRYIYHLRSQIAFNRINEKLLEMPKDEYNNLAESLYRSMDKLDILTDTLKNRLATLTKNSSEEESKYIQNKLHLYILKLQNDFYDSFSQIDYPSLVKKYIDKPIFDGKLPVHFIDSSKFIGAFRKIKDTAINDYDLKNKILTYHYLDAIEKPLLDRSDKELLDLLTNYHPPQFDINKMREAERGKIARAVNVSKDELAFFVNLTVVTTDPSVDLFIHLSSKSTNSFSALNVYKTELNLLYGLDLAAQERLVALTSLERAFSSYREVDYLAFYQGYLGRELTEEEKKKLKDIQNAKALTPGEARNYFLDPYQIMLKEHNLRIELLNRIPSVKFHARPLIALIRGIFTTVNIDWIKRQLAASSRIKLKVAEVGLFDKTLKYVITDLNNQSTDILICNEDPFKTGQEINIYEGIINYPDDYVDLSVNQRTYLQGASIGYNRYYYDQSSLIHLFNTLVKDSNPNLNFFETWKLHALQLFGNDELRDSYYKKADKPHSYWKEEKDRLSTVTVKVCLEYICQYPNLLNQDIVQHRIYNLISQPYLLKSALVSDPQFFIDMGPKLAIALTQIPETDNLSTLFVLNLCDKIHQEMAWIKKYHEEFPQDRSQRSIFESTYIKGFINAYNQLEKAIPVQDRNTPHRFFRFQRASNLQKGYAVFLLDHIKTHPPSNSNEIVNVLQAYFILNASPASVGHPYIIQNVLEHLKHTFLPHIANQFKKDAGLRNAVLSELAEINTTWVLTDSIYKFIADPEGIEVDISNGIGFTLKIREASDSQLPSRVFNSSSFLKAFGPNFKPRVRSTAKSEGIIEYSFEIEDVEFKINYHKFGIGTEIYQIFENVPYKFKELHLEETALKLTAIINANGVWVDNRTNSFYLARHGNLLKKERILLHFKKSFFQNYLVAASIGEGKDRTWICQDQYRIFMRAVNCCSSHFVLMSTSNDKKRLQRIDLPSGLSLIRKTEDIWVQDDRPEMQWWIQGTEFLETEFGHEYTEFMLALKNTDNKNCYALWIYPYQILATGKLDAKLNFIKPVDDDPAPKAVKIEKTSKGYKGDHAAFLYLAYYFYIRGEHAKAAKYIDLMWKYGTSDKHTVDSLQKNIEFFISNLPATDIQRVLLLKALINITLIFNNISGSLGIALENKETIISKLLGLAEVYNTIIVHPILSQRINEQGLNLKPYEVKLLSDLKEDAIKRQPLQMIPIGVKPSVLCAFYPTKDEMITFGESIKRYTLSSKSSNIHALHKKYGSYPKIDTVLSHFWDYVAWISTEKDLKHSDVYFLYNSVPSLSAYEHPASRMDIDTARRFLIMLYELKKSNASIEGVLITGDDGKKSEELHIKHLREDVQKLRSGFPSYRAEVNGELTAAGLIKTMYYEFKEDKTYLTAVNAYFTLFYSYLAHNKSGLTRDDYIGNVKFLNDDKIRVIENPTEETKKKEINNPKEDIQTKDPTQEEDRKENAFPLPYAYKFKETPVTRTDLINILGKNPVSRSVEAKPFIVKNNEVNEWNDCFTEAESISGLEGKQKEINAYLNLLTSRKDNYGDMVRADVEKIQTSIELAKAELSNKKHQKLKQADKNFLDVLDIRLKSKIANVKANRKEINKLLTDTATQHASALGLQNVSKSQIIEKLIEMYLSGFWNGLQDEKIVTDLDHNMTNFLLDSTELQQLSKARKILETLKSSNVNPASKNWEYLSTDLFYHLTEGSKRGRIKAYGEDFYKPFLVHEYQNKVICREKAVQGVKDLLADKPVFAKIRMGVGKSTFIFNHLAKQWLRKGVRPVVIFTEKLLRQSLGYMEQNAYVFNFDRNFGLPLVDGKNEYSYTHIISHLNDIHESLIRLPMQNRYVVTTLERRAALRAKKHELEASLKEHIDSNNFSKLQTLSMQLDLVTKISAFFNNENTRYLVDEDVNLNINLEFNYSFGSDCEISKTRSSMANQLMHWLLIAPIQQTERFKLLVDLRKKVIEKKIQSLPYEEVEPALFQLAEFASEDEGFWVNEIGFTTEQFKDLKSNRNFVKFVMQEKVNREFFVPEFFHQLKRKSKSDKTLSKALDKLEIFQKQLSEAFQSVYKTHPDLKRGIQKSSLCVIVPEDGGVQKPNVVFGDEDAMILQHYLFYAVNPPNNDYFDFRYRELSSKDTPAWIQWNETIGLGDSPYANICKPQNVFHRLMLCRYILEESKAVRIYNEQLVTNSQDIYPDHAKSVASGTGYPFVINMSEPGMDNDTIDSIIGQTLLSMDFNAKVTVSNDILGSVVDLPNNKDCLGIINQAYSVCGNETRKFAEHIRRHSGTERNLVFVETESREKMISKVGKEPVPLPSDILRKDDFLVLGPRDTVGIDFKLSRGEKEFAQLLVDSTTTLDDFEQALNRLRDLGFGQQGHISIDDVMAARITGWSGVPASDITQGHVILDIIMRTVADKSNNNVKAAAFRIKRILKTRLEKALHNFTPTIEGAIIHSAIFQGFRSIFIEDRTKRASEQFLDTKMLSPRQFLETIYDSTLEQLRQFLDRAIINVVKSVDRRMSENEIINQKEFLYSLLSSGDPRFPQELVEVYKAVRAAESKLVLEKKKLKDWEDYFNKYLPKENPSNASFGGMTELQIMVQVQLKIEQMLHLIRTDIPDDKEYPAVSAYDVESQFEKMEPIHYRHLAMSYCVGSQAAFLPESLKKEFVHFRKSVSSEVLFRKMNTSEQPLFYALASSVSGNWQFCLVTQGEWSSSLSSDFLKRRKDATLYTNLKEDNTTLYPVFWGNTDTMIPVDGKRPKSYTPEFILAFNKFRFILGYTKFNKEELVGLGMWANSLTAQQTKDLAEVFNDADRPESQKLLTELLSTSTAKRELPTIDDPD